MTGEAPTVSVVDNAVSSNLTSEYLERQPLSRDVNSLVNQVPGVNSGRAYGSTEERTLAFNLDGVNVSNPASGEHWALTNPDWIKEIQVVGLGAPAEYGGFTGAAFNLVTKSGGNNVRGDFVAYYTGGDLVSTNAPASAAGTALLPSTTDSDFDLSVNLGGPAIKDRLWYFASAQYANAVTTPYYRGSSPESQREDVDDTKHRYMGKLTYQATERTQLVGMAFFDDRLVDNRGAGGLLLSTAARTQESPNWEYNATAESLLSSTNFLSVKFTGFSGRDDRLPNYGADKPGRNDDSTGFGWDNAAFTLKQKVERATLDASWSLFADSLFGGGDSHTFKFGANYEWGAYDQQQPRNGGFSYYDRSSRCPGATADDRTAAYFANPACAAYSSDRGNEIFLDSVQRGFNIYAQDSMRLNRVTVNVGLRYTRYDAGFANGDESVYEVSMLAPRLGLVWDVFGTSKTALKAHYGRYFLGMFAYLYDREVSGEAYTPSEIWDYNPVTGKYDKFVSSTLTTATLDTGAGHPYTDQYLFSVEQQLGRKSSLGLDLIYRDDGDIFAMVNENGDYADLRDPGQPAHGRDADGPRPPDVPPVRPRERAGRLPPLQLGDPPLREALRRRLVPARLDRLVGPRRQRAEEQLLRSRVPGLERAGERRRPPLELLDVGREALRLRRPPVGDQGQRLLHLPLGRVLDPVRAGEQQRHQEQRDQREPRRARDGAARRPPPRRPPLRQGLQARRDVRPLPVRRCLQHPQFRHRDRRGRPLGNDQLQRDHPVEEHLELPHGLRRPDGHGEPPADPPRREGRLLADAPPPDR